MNHMAEVAKMLGVELGEEFEVNENKSKKFRFIENRFEFFTSGSWVCDANAAFELDNLLSGVHTIKRKPWKPKIGENYWVIVPDGDISEYAWLDSLDDNSNYKLGNCYRTREEAEANRDKWVAFYASDEVLEV